MVQYSRWSALPLPLENVNLNDVLNETRNSLHVAIESNQAQINIPENLPTIVANKTMLGQVFQNLISNAIRYKHPDRSPVIGIDITERSEATLITVSDNGIGFDTTYKDRIFDIFQKLDSTVKGSQGLGLAICKRLIEKKGGRIWADSRVGQGSTFYISLPKKDETVVVEHGL
jgi:light-regulated signal transduction histidine kinase (bacteriophytochrome)